MIITERKHDKDEFLFSPIYFLTGDVETAKFYSNLASASSKFGTYLEKKIRETIKLPFINNLDDINHLKEKSVLKKQKIGKVEPDFIIIDPSINTISICEIKTNLFNMDSNLCRKANETGLEMKEYFGTNFSNYISSVYLVNFLGFRPSKRGKYVLDLTNNFIIIEGDEFSKIIDVDYGFVINSLKNNRKINQEFIDIYKNKPIEYTHA